MFIDQLTDSKLQEAVNKQQQFRMNLAQLDGKFLRLSAIVIVVTVLDIMGK